MREVRQSLRALPRRLLAFKTADALGLEIAGVGEDTAVVQVIGDDSRLAFALKAFESYGITETIRSGALTMEL